MRGRWFRSNFSRPPQVCRSPEYADKQPVGFEGEISTVVRVAGELAEFFECVDRVESSRLQSIAHAAVP